MAKFVYLHSARKTTGPFSVDELESRRRAGELPPDAKIHDGQGWVPAADFLAREAVPSAIIPGPVAPGPVSGATPAADPETMLQTALVLEPEPASRLSAVPWESLLFILSFPILIPSLIVMYATAKRWGHIDIYLIILHGLVFTTVGFVAGPWIGAMMLVSWISSVWLYWMRRDRQREGIFLGYSNLVSLLLIVGGALAIGGFATTFPWSAHARWGAAREAPIATNSERVRDRAIPRDRQVILKGATLDLENAIHRRRFGGVWRFAARKKPADVWFDQSGLRTLWSTYQTVVGRDVELVGVTSSGFGSVRDRVEIQDGAAKLWLNTPSLHFSLVNGPEPRVWVVSSTPIGAKVFSTRGIARAIYNDPSVASAYSKLQRGNLPLMGIAIFEGETGPPPPPPPTPEAEEIWVPVKGERGQFWVRFPPGVTPTGNEPAAGYYIGDAPEFPGLGEVGVQLFSRDQGRILYQQTTGAYLKEQGIFEQMKATVAWKNGLWLAAGVLILGAAAWRAREE